MADIPEPLTMEDLAPRDMPASQLYESSIRDAYRAARDTAAKSQLTMDLNKAEPRLRDAVDFDFDTELRRTRRMTILDRPPPRYKTLEKDDKLISGEPTEFGSDSDSDVGEDSAYIARRPYTMYDRESTVYGNRRYYSRSDADDPDYFDFDLQHSIDLFRKPAAGSSSSGASGSGSSASAIRGRIGTSNPALWEKKDFEKLYSMKPDRMLSSELYSDRTKKFLEDENDEEPQASGAGGHQIDRGLASTALRTPAYWARRFESLTNIK